MIPRWRLTRNRYTRRLYDALCAAGLTASSMVEYVAALEGTSPSARGDDRLPADVSFEAGPAPEVGERFDIDFAVPVAPLDGEWVVVATAGGEAIGRALVSAGHRPYVDSLGRRLPVEGAYVRRVYVDREWRDHGIAKRLVGETLRVAKREFGTECAVAVIAPDNKPSLWAFESNGFEPARRHDYVSVFGREWRRVTEL